MTNRRYRLAAALAVASIVATPSAAIALDKDERKVEQYTCKDIMRESGSGRDTAIAFLHGFLLGKSGGSSFTLEALTKQTEPSSIIAWTTQMKRQWTP